MAFNREFNLPKEEFNEVKEFKEEFNVFIKSYEPPSKTDQRVSETAKQLLLTEKNNKDYIFSGVSEKDTIKILVNQVEIDEFNKNVEKHFAQQAKINEKKAEVESRRTRSQSEKIIKGGFDSVHLIEGDTSVENFYIKKVKELQAQNDELLFTINGRFWRVHEQEVVIEKQKEFREEQKKLIEEQKATINEKEETIEGQEEYIKEQEKVIETQKEILEGQNKFIKRQEKVIEKQKEQIIQTTLEKGLLLERIESLLGENEGCFQEITQLQCEIFRLKKQLAKQPEQQEVTIYLKDQQNENVKTHYYNPNTSIWSSCKKDSGQEVDRTSRQVEKRNKTGNNLRK